MTPIQQYSIIFGSLILIMLMFFQWYTQGFFFTYARVKGSKGKKLLLKVRTKSGHYHTVGKMTVDGMLQYRTREGKVDKTISSVLPGCIYSVLGVKCADVDEETNGLIDHLNWKFVSGHDAERVDDKIVTALQKPSLNNKQTVIIILICLAIAVSLACAYFGYKNYALTQQVLQRISATIATSPVSPA